MAPEQDKSILLVNGTAHLGTGKMYKKSLIGFKDGKLTAVYNAAVVDASFISLRLIVPHLIALLPAASPVIALIKPQFEAGRGEVGKGGVVRDPEVRQRAVQTVVDACREAGCTVHATTPSSLPGPKGNVEEFVWFSTPGRESDAP